MDTGNDVFRLETIAYAEINDVDAACQWVDDNRAYKKGDNVVVFPPFYEGAKEQLINIENMVDNMKQKRCLDVSYYYGGEQGRKDPKFLFESTIEKDVKNAKDMLRNAAADGQALSVYKIEGSVCWCGYGSRSTILPVSLFNIHMQKDYSSYAESELLKIGGGAPVGNGVNAVSIGGSLSDAKRSNDTLSEEMASLQREMDSVRNGQTAELREMKKKIDRMQAELIERKETMLREMQEREAKLQTRMQEVKKQLLLLDAQIYAVRCRTGEVIRFTKIMDGEECAAEEPVLVYQSVRFLDEELGRHLSMYMGKNSDTGEMRMTLTDVLKYREDIRELFVPDRKCISVIQMSRTGTIVSKMRDALGNTYDVLKQYEVYHGKQVAILVRNGGNLYIGWTDAERVVLDKGQVFLTPGKKEIAEEDAVMISRTSTDVFLSRYYLLHMIQGIIEAGTMLKIPSAEHMFDRDNRYIVFSTANGAIEDTRYGTFASMLDKSKDIPLKNGDDVISIMNLHGSDKPNENKYGIGYINRTRNCRISSGEIYRINKIQYDLHIEATIGTYAAKPVKMDAPPAWAWSDRYTDGTWYKIVRDGDVPQSVETIKECVITAQDVHDYMLDNNMNKSVNAMTESELIDLCIYSKSYSACFSDFYKVDGYYYRNNNDGDGEIRHERQKESVFEENGTDVHSNTYYKKEFVHAKIVGKDPHYHVSLPMRYAEYSFYRETDARANMEILYYWSPVYLCGTWLRYVVDSRRIGNIRVADSAFGYTHCLPFIKTMLQYIENREKTEKTLLRGAGLGDWLDDDKAEEAWDVELVEWRIANRCRALTKASAARFAKYINGRKKRHERAGSAKAESKKLLASVGELTRFEILVKYMAEVWDTTDDEETVAAYDKFTDAIQDSGQGEEGFGVAGSRYSFIETYHIKKPHERSYFYAEYYDGQQAPFDVCTWYGSIEELEELLEKTAPKLFDGYLAVVGKQVN